MALSIKNPEVEQAAKELAQLRGQTVTRAVLEAVRAALLRERGRRVAPCIKQTILEVSARCAALPDLDTRDPDEILGYNEEGVFD